MQSRSRLDMINHTTIEAFLKERRLNNIINSDNTVRSYRFKLIAWHDFCKGINDDMAESYLFKLTASYSSVQVKNTLYVLKSFYDWQDDGSNPFKSLSKKYRVNKKENYTKKIERDARVLSGKEVSRLLAHAESIFTSINITQDPMAYYLAYRNWFIVSIMSQYGMRISGLVGININDIDLQRRYMTIYDSKNGEPYPIPIKTMLSSVSAYLNIRNMLMKDISGDETALLLSKSGKRLSDTAARRAVNRLAKDIDLYDSGRSTHQLRHYRATQYYKDNMPLDLISTVMGVSVPVLKKTYLHLTDDDTVRQYEDWIKGARGGFVCPRCGYSGKDEVVEMVKLEIVK